MLALDLDQIILIDKPANLTSFGVVARIRRLLQIEFQKKVKVGHAGTLDPFATGLMLVLTGKMTKQASDFLKLDKSYLATFVLGWETNTFDTEGKLLRQSRYQPSWQSIQAKLKNFCGLIEQTPPAFSAIKINGRRAYDLARSGQEVIIPTRLVEIKSIELVDYDYPRLTIRVYVSSGTYIRSLARDIGYSLGAGGYCLSLRRESIGNYELIDAKKLSDFGIID